MSEENNPRAPETETVDISAQVAEFPSEPFPCPACGQLLAPSCRVCVACKHTIDPAEVALQKQLVVPVLPAPSTEPRPERVRYSWRMFFAVLGVSFLLALMFEGFWGEQKAQVAMAGAQTLAGVWVFFDALRRGIPRPLRWAVGSMVLPVFVFPWYLARRSRPRSSVPFVEAEVGPVTRFLLFALLFLFLFSLVYYLVKGPAPTTTPTSAPKEHKSSDSSRPRVANVQLEKIRRRKSRNEVPRPCAVIAGVQAETSAPSDAWQT